MTTSTAEKLLNIPPIAVAGAYIGGLGLSQWAALVTIAYTLMLAYFRIRKELNNRRRRDRRRGDTPEAEDE